MYHRFEHLRRRDDPLSEQAAFCYEVFLDRRKLFKGYLNAHIASAYHNSRAVFDYLLNIVYSRLILDLRDEVDIPAAVFAYEVIDVEDILLSRNEGAGDKIYVVLDSEEDIGFVLLA